MNGSASQPRAWLRRARALRDRHAREQEGACVVEGIRQVVSAIEGGHEVDALLIDPLRLRSDVAWDAVRLASNRGATVVELPTCDMERLSTRDNPVGLVAIIRWSPMPLDALPVEDDALYLVADDVHDPGNLGTLARTTDAAGGRALIVLGGTDPAHPAALRASLGTMFRLPVHLARSHDELFAWAAGRCRTVATSAHADQEVWQTDLRPPLAILAGNEARGLDAATVARCDLTTRIPMLGTATSLNVAIAAGVILYEARRQAGV